MMVVVAVLAVLSLALRAVNDARLRSLADRANHHAEIAEDTARIANQLSTVDPQLSKSMSSQSKVHAESARRYRTAASRTIAVGPSEIP
jgi:peptidoglycan hydrolase CwlO-like protein